MQATGSRSGQGQGQGQGQGIICGGPADDSDNVIAARAAARVPIGGNPDGASGAASTRPDASSQGITDTSKGVHVFWGSGSPPAWRVLIAANEKGLDFTDHLLSFASGDTKSAWYLKMNPRGMVPLLVDNGVVVTESLAILQYLERYFPEKPLVPSEKHACARTLRLMHESNNVSSVSGEIVFYVRRTPPHALNLEYLTAKRAQMHKELALWESFLHGRRFLVGESVTLADVAFFPNLAYNIRLGMNVMRYPNLNKYYQMMCARPTVQKHWPPHWKGSKGLPILSDTLPSVPRPPASTASPSPTPSSVMEDSSDDSEILEAD